MAPHSKQKIYLSSLEEIKSWFEHNTKIIFKDGKESRRRATSFSSNELFAHFRIVSSNKVGKTVFIRIQKELHILKSKHSLYDLFSCPKCPQRDKLEQRLLDPSIDQLEKIKIEEKLTKLKLHKVVAAAQWDSFHNICSNLDSESCLALQDFGKQFTQEGKAVILVIILLMRVDEKLCWRYLDFFDSKEYGHSDFEFVEASWLSLVETCQLNRFSKIHIFSDGGSGDFYNSTCLYFFSSFQSIFNIEVECSYFVEYHGHSRCDGHIGTAKRKIHKMSQLLDQSFDNNFVYNMFSSLEDTCGKIIEIQHDHIFRVKTMAGIKSFKHFKFPFFGEVDCYMNTSALTPDKHYCFVLKGNEKTKTTTTTTKAT
jgi:hypothetical protein